MEINFVTHNKDKVKEFKQILEPDIKVNHTDIEYRELRSDDPEEIVRIAVKKLAEKFQKPVVIEDSGLFIPALKDFPGTCSAYIHKRIGLKGILKLMEGIEDRSALYKSAVGYCEPGKRPISFLGTENGNISNEMKGDNGFGHDPIFIPTDFQQTYGEMPDVKELKKFRRRAASQLASYLRKNAN